MTEMPDLPTLTPAESAAGIECFSFGDPVPVTSLRETYYEGVWATADGWYTPPVPPHILAQTYRATAHHGSAVQLKRNMLVQSIIPHPLLPVQQLRAWVLDYLVFGNSFLQRTKSRTGKTLQFTRVPAKYVRRGIEPDSFLWFPNWHDRQELPKGSIHHLLEPDVDQEIYGVPDYLGALQSTWLSEASTLFRRKYYINGSHAGFIMYVSDAAAKEDDINAIRAAMKEAKGPGNFRNLFLYLPNGKKEGVQVIPIAQVGAADEYFHISQITRDAQLAAHRIPPHLLGIVPTNGASFGSVAEAAQVFTSLEIQSLQTTLADINAWSGLPLIQFRPPPTP